jgi:hypothetical protein
VRPVPSSMAQPSLQLAIFRAFSPYLAARTGLVVLPAAFVPTQPFFDADGRLFRTVICVCGHSFRFEQRARIEMQYSLGAESKTVFANRRMSRIATPKIFRGGLFDPIGYFPLESCADTDISSRNA